MSNKMKKKIIARGGIRTHDPRILSAVLSISPTLYAPTQRADDGTKHVL